MSYEPGDMIDGKYRIVRLLGEGGMGAVYEGDHERIHRRVAIKVLHTVIAAKADVVQRFEREAQAAGRIGSEHIVEVLDLGITPQGERYMVMEFLEGESLGERIRRKQHLSAREIAGVLQQLLAGLEAAHGAEIIHRDLKPDNVFLARDRTGHRDFVKILDFGVSKFLSAESELYMTQSGAVVGTPFYMSPEQARGLPIDLRSDLYSVGVVAYQAITGRIPFKAATFNELVFKIALEVPEPIEVLAPGLDPAFTAIIRRAMARDPADRYPSGREFRAAVEAWLASAGAALDRSGAAAVPDAALDPAKTVPYLQAPLRRWRTPVLGVASTLLIVLAGFGVYRHRAAPPRVASLPLPPTVAVPTMAPRVEEPAPVPSTSAEPAPSRPVSKPVGHAAKPKPSVPSATSPQPPTTLPGRTIGSEL